MQRQPKIRSGLVWPIGATLLTLLVYGRSVAPGLVGGDSPELVAAAVTLGIPHQPGYPLYILLGRIISLLFPGDPTLALNAFSALAGATAAGFGCVLARRWGAPGPVAFLLAVSAGLAWPVWAQAVVAEVYALGLFLAMATVVSVDRWTRTRTRRWVFVSAYVAGLAVSHQPLNVMVVLGAAAVALATSPPPWTRSTIVAAAGLFLSPFTAFLVLPIRSDAHPPIDYAQIESVGDFFYHALGVASRSEFLSEGGEGVRRTGTLYAGLLLRGAGWLTPLLVIMGVVGVGLSTRRHPARALLVGVPIAAIVGFSFVYAILDVENYAIIPWWLLVLASAPAWGAIASRGRTGLLSVTALLAVIAIGAFAANRPRCDRSDYHLVDDFVANVSAEVPEHGALFLLTETLATPFVHQREVRGARSDMRVIDMTGKVARGDLGFRGIGGDWHENRWRRIEQLRVAPPPDLSTREWRTLMFQTRRSPEPRVTYRTRGLTTAITGLNDQRGEDAIRAWSRLRLRLPHPALTAADRTGFSLTPTILRLYGDLALRAADVHLARGALERAELRLRQVLDLSPRSAAARSRLASIYLETNRAELAEEELRRVLEFGGEDAAALSALGVVRLQRGDPVEAEALLSRAVARDPALAAARANLGFLLAREPNRIREAIEHLEAFLSLAPDDPSAPDARRFVEELRQP